MEIRHRFIFSLALLGMLACRPVWTVGWTELFILAGIVLLFAGPSLWRFYRRYRKFREYEAKKKEQK